MQQFINTKNTFFELKMDFIGISFSFSDLLSIIVYIFFSLVFFLYLFFIGQKIRKLIFPITEKWGEKLFISLALGYILICSLIALLGSFSLLSSLSLYVFIFLTTCFIIFPISSLASSVHELYNSLKSKKINWKKHTLLKTIIFILIIISFLRLLPPEINADALSYHISDPKLYLHYQTMMITPKGTEYSVPIPQLGEMPYILVVFFNIIDAARYVHFTFYILSILLLIFLAKRIEKNYFPLLTAIIFMTSPLVLHIASSAHSDFHALFCFLLATLLITREKKLSKTALILSGIIFGGALGTKIWMLFFFPVFLLFILLKANVFKRKYTFFSIRQTLLFSSFSLLVAGFWYIRSYILSGDFFYHNEMISPLIQKSNISEKMMTIFNFSAKAGHDYFLDYSPLFFLGLVGILLAPLTIYKKIKNTQIYLFIFLLLLLCIFLPSAVFNLRYLLPAYILFILISSFGLITVLKNKLRKTFVVGLIIFLITFFSLNTLTFLPYGLGWANKDDFLKRRILRQNAVYYNFTNDFLTNTNSNEVIATYGIIAFYYANYIHKHVYHIFNENNNLLKDIKKQNISKLMIKGGDIHWFCRELDIKDCKNVKVELLASYEPAKLYLYAIR